MRFLLIIIVCVFFDVATKPKLADFGYDKYTQSGEDGIIQKIFEIIGTTSKVCIEFGAWDGFHLANTALLWSEQEWKGILIESDGQKVEVLKRNIAPYNCVAIQAFVGNQPTNSLETILRTHSINDSIDLLSIDIDGDDYYIFDSLQTLRPRGIICEYNPTIPVEYDVYPSNHNYFGCSAQALIRIARSKGYFLVAMTETNCFFVLADLMDKFEDYQTDLQKIKLTKWFKYIITGYDGQYAIIGDTEIMPYGLNNPYSRPLHGDFKKITRNLE